MGPGEEAKSLHNHSAECSMCSSPAIAVDMKGLASIVTTISLLGVYTWPGVSRDDKIFLFSCLAFTQTHAHILRADDVGI